MNHEMREASWLARWELRRTWPSYPFTLAVGVFFGLLAWTVMTDLYEEAESLPVDIFLLAICTALTSNFGSRDSWISPRCAYPERLAFFRGLPISTRDIVLSRALSRVPPLLLNTVGVFATPYIISAISGGGLAGEVPPASYLWFTLMWLGYALLTGSWVLYGELGVHGRTFNWISFTLVLPFALAILVLELTVPARVVPGMFYLVDISGPLFAAAFLAVGVTSFCAWIAFTSRRLRRRDLLT